MQRYFPWKQLFYFLSLVFISVQSHTCLSIWQHSLDSQKQDGSPGFCSFPSQEVLNVVPQDQLSNNRVFLNPFKNYFLELNLQIGRSQSCFLRVGKVEQTISSCLYPIQQQPSVATIQETSQFEQLLNTSAHTVKFADESLHVEDVFQQDAKKVLAQSRLHADQASVRVNFSSIATHVIYSYTGSFQGEYVCVRDYSVKGVSAVVDGKLSIPTIVPPEPEGLESVLVEMDSISSDKVQFFTNGPKEAFVDVLLTDNVHTCDSVSLLPLRYNSYKNLNIADYSNHTQVLFSLGSVNNDNHPMSINVQNTLIDALSPLILKGLPWDTYLVTPYTRVPLPETNVVWDLYKEIADASTSIDVSVNNSDAEGNNTNIKAFTRPDSLYAEPSADSIFTSKTRLEQLLLDVLNAKNASQMSNSKVWDEAVDGTGVTSFSTFKYAPESIDTSVVPNKLQDNRPVTAYINIGSVFTNLEDDYYSFRIKSTGNGMFCSGEQSFQTPGTTHDYQAFLCMTIPWQQVPVLVLKSNPQADVMRSMFPCSMFVGRESIFLNQSNHTTSEEEKQALLRLTEQNRAVFPLQRDDIWTSASYNVSQSTISDSDLSLMWNRGIRALYVAYSIINNLGQSSITWASIKLLPPSFVPVPLAHFTKYIPTIYDDSFFAVYPIRISENYEGLQVHDGTKPVTQTRPFYNAQQNVHLSSQITVFWECNPRIDPKKLFGDQQWSSRITISYSQVLNLWPRDIPLLLNAKVFYRVLSASERLIVNVLQPDEVVPFSFSYTDVAKGGTCNFVLADAAVSMGLNHSMPLVSSVQMECNNWMSGNCNGSSFCKELWFGQALLRMDNPSEAYGPFVNTSVYSGGCVYNCDGPVESRIMDTNFTYTAQISKHAHENQGSSSYVNISPFYNSPSIVSKKVNREYLIVNINKGYRIASNIVDRFQQLNNFMQVNLVDMQVVPTGNQLLYVMPGVVPPKVTSSSIEQTETQILGTVVGIINSIQDQNVNKSDRVCKASLLRSLYYLLQHQHLSTATVDHEYAEEVLIDARRFFLIEQGRSLDITVGFSFTFVDHLSNAITDVKWMSIIRNTAITAVYTDPGNGRHWTDIPENFDFDAISKVLNVLAHLGLDMYYTTHNMRLFTMWLTNEIFIHAVTPSVSLCSAIEPSWRRIVSSVIKMVQYVFSMAPSVGYSTSYFQAELLGLPPPPLSTIDIPVKFIDLTLVKKIDFSMKLLDLADIQRLEMRCNKERLATQVFFSDKQGSPPRADDISRKTRRVYKDDKDRLLHTLGMLSTIRACFSHTLMMSLLFIERHKASIGKAIMPVFYAEQYATHTSTSMGNILFGRYAQQNLAEPMALANLTLLESPYIRYINNIVTVGASGTNIADAPLTLTAFPEPSPDYDPSMYEQPCGHPMSGQQQRVKTVNLIDKVSNLGSLDTLSSISYLEVSLYQIALVDVLVASIGQANNQLITPAVSVHVNFRSYSIKQPRSLPGDEVIMEYIEQTSLSSRSTGIVYLIPNALSRKFDIPSPMTNEVPAQRFMDIGQFNDEEYVLQCLQLRHSVVRDIYSIFSTANTFVNESGPFTDRGCYLHSLTDVNVVCVCSSPGITFARMIQKKLISIAVFNSSTDKNPVLEEAKHLIHLESVLASGSLCIIFLLLIFIPILCFKRDKALIGAAMHAYAEEWKQGNPCVNNLTYMKACFGKDYTNSLIRKWLHQLNCVPIEENDGKSQLKMLQSKLRLAWPSYPEYTDESLTESSVVSSEESKKPSVSIPTSTQRTSSSENSQAKYSNRNQTATAQLQRGNDAFEQLCETIDRNEDPVVPETVSLQTGHPEEKSTSLYARYIICKAFLLSVYQYDFFFSFHSLLSIVLPQLGDGLSVTLKAYQLLLTVIFENVTVYILVSVMGNQHYIYIILLASFAGACFYFVLRMVLNSSHRHRLKSNFFQFVRAIARNEVEGKYTGFFNAQEADFEYNLPLSPEELDQRYEDVKKLSESDALPPELQQVYSKLYEQEMLNRTKQSEHIVSPMQDSSKSILQGHEPMSSPPPPPPQQSTTLRRYDSSSQGGVQLSSPKNSDSVVTDSNADDSNTNDTDRIMYAAIEHEQTLESDKSFSTIPVHRKNSSHDSVIKVSPLLMDTAQPHTKEDIKTLIGTLRVNKLKSRVTSSSAAILLGIYWNQNFRLQYERTAKSLRAQAVNEEKQVKQPVMVAEGEQFQNIVHDMRQYAMDGFNLSSHSVKHGIVESRSAQSKKLNSVARAATMQENDELELSHSLNYSYSIRNSHKTAISRQYDVNRNVKPNPMLLLRTQQGEAPHPLPPPHITPSTHAGADDNRDSTFISDERSLFPSNFSPFCNIRPKEYVDSFMFNENCSPYFYLGTPLQLQADVEKMHISPKLFPFALPFQNRYLYSQIPCLQDQAKLQYKSTQESEALHRLSYQLMREMPAVCSVCMLLTSQCRCEASVALDNNACISPQNNEPTSDSGVSNHVIKNVSKSRIHVVNQLASWFTVISAPLRIPYTKDSLQWKIGISSAIAAEDILKRQITTCKECSYVLELCVCNVRERFQELRKLEKKTGFVGNTSTIATLNKIWGFITKRTEEIATSVPPKIQREDSNSYKVSLMRKNRRKDQMKILEQLGMWQQFSPKEMQEILHPVLNNSTASSANASNQSLTHPQNGKLRAHSTFNSSSTAIVTEDEEALKGLSSSPVDVQASSLQYLNTPRQLNLRAFTSFPSNNNDTPPLSSPPTVPNHAAIEMTDVHRQERTSFSDTVKEQSTRRRYFPHSLLYAEPTWIAPSLVSDVDYSSQQMYDNLPEVCHLNQVQIMSQCNALQKANCSVVKHLESIVGYDMYHGVPSHADPREPILAKLSNQGLHSPHKSKTSPTSQTIGSHCENMNCVSHILLRRAVAVNGDDLVNHFLNTRPLDVIPYQVLATDDYGRPSKTSSRMVQSYSILLLLYSLLIVALVGIFMYLNMPEHHSNLDSALCIVATIFLDQFIISPIILSIASLFRSVQECSGYTSWKDIYTPLYLQNRLFGDLSTHTCCYKQVTKAVLQMEVAMKLGGEFKNEHRCSASSPSPIPSCSCGVSLTKESLYACQAYRGIFQDPFADSCQRGYNDNITSDHTDNCALKMYLLAENRKNQASSLLWWRDRGISSKVYGVGNVLAERIVEDISRAQPFAAEDPVTEQDQACLRRSVDTRAITPHVFDFLGESQIPTKSATKNYKGSDVLLMELCEVVDRTKGWIYSDTAVHRGPLRTWDDVYLQREDA